MIRLSRPAGRLGPRAARRRIPGAVNGAGRQPLGGPPIFVGIIPIPLGGINKHNAVDARSPPRLQRRGPVGGNWDERSQNRERNPPSGELPPAFPKPADCGRSRSSGSGDFGGGIRGKRGFRAGLLPAGLAEICVGKRNAARQTNRSVFRQSSSVVEQGTHKPLVGSSILPSGTTFQSKSWGTPIGRRRGRLTYF